MTYEIEKNIPIARRGGGSFKKGKSKYPFGKMLVGDSFFVPNVQAIKKPHFYTIAKKAGIKIRIANQDGGIRVWRIE